jgi:hypothetical protein
MRPWTVICTDGDKTKAMNMSAPYDYTAAKTYIMLACSGKVIAIIPGTHADRVSVLNDHVLA